MRAGSVLLVGNYLPSVAAVRTLAATGYNVILGDGGEFSPARHSRDCHEIWRHPPVERPQDFIEALLSFLASRSDVSVVLPLRGDYVECLAGARERIPGSVVVATPPHDVVRTCLDKLLLYRIAEQAGVRILPIATAHDLEGLLAAAQEVGFPCIVRPTRDTGPLLVRGHSLIIARDEAGLLAAMASWPEGHDALVLQRYISGARQDVSFIAAAGRILARLESRVLRTDRIDGTGLRVAGVSTPDDPGLVRQCDALIAALGYTGVGVAQFIIGSDGPRFLELNPRPGLAIAFMERSGLDLVLAAIDLAQDKSGRPGRPQPQPVVGRRYAWTSRDLYGLGRAWARGDADITAAARWLAGAIRAAVTADVHLTWSIRDPMPTLAVYGHLLSLSWAGSRGRRSARAEKRVA